MKLLQAQYSRVAIPADFQLLLDLQELIEFHFKEHRDPEFYALRLSISLTILNTLCKGYYNKTVYAVLISRLLREARMLLRCSRLPVKLIAFELGFADPGNFSRFFLRETGERPGTYRKRCRFCL